MLLAPDMLLPRLILNENYATDKMQSQVRRSWLSTNVFKRLSDCLDVAKNFGENAAAKGR